MDGSEGKPIASDPLSASYRRSLVELMGGPLDGTRVSVERKSRYVRADLPRELGGAAGIGIYRATYVRTSPTSFQHQSTNIVTGD